MTARRLLPAALVAVAGLGAPLCAQELTVATAPPVVVKTVPEAGTIDADPASTEIRISFSKPMQDGSWSVVQAFGNSVPKMAGEIHYDKDGKTCILPVTLEPGRDYALWLNTARFQNFKDRDRRPAVPYLLVFRTRGAPAKTTALSGKTWEVAYDALCDDMSQHYSYFALKNIDWNALRRQYRPRAASARDSAAFVDVLRELLGQLEDGHVWIDDHASRMATYVPPRRPANFNRRATLSTLEQTQDCGDFAVVGLTQADHFGAIVLRNQPAADSEVVAQAVAFIAANREAPGFLIDLRTAAGGDERLAREIASHFARERRSMPAAGSAVVQSQPISDLRTSGSCPPRAIRTCDPSFA